MNIIGIETKIINAYTNGDVETIKSLYEDMTSSLLKMDRWFDRYIDLFDEKIAMVDSNDPIRKLYDSKFQEYSTLNHLIKVAQHYMVKK